MHYLTEDWSGHNKVAGTGWANTEFRTYVLEEEEDGNVKLVETEGSRASREDIPLGYTEKKQLLESVTKN